MIAAVRICGSLFHMKFVATSDFRAGGKHVAKGEMVEYNDEKLIGQLRAAGRLAELGIPEALKAKAEVAEERNRNRRNKREPWTLDRRLKLLAFIISLLALAFLVWRAMKQ